MGTWGPGAFDNDDALDLLDALAGQDTARRRRSLERIVDRPPGHLDDVGWLEDGAGEIIAAVAVIAAGLPHGEAIARAIAGQGYDAAAVTVPEDPVLAGHALAALLVTAGQDPRVANSGAWNFGWSPAEAALARRTTGELASVFRRYEHRYDQELPLVW